MIIHNGKPKHCLIMIIRIIRNAYFLYLKQVNRRPGTRILICLYKAYIIIMILKKMNLKLEKVPRGEEKGKKSGISGA